MTAGQIGLVVLVALTAVGCSHPPTEYCTARVIGAKYVCGDGGVVTGWDCAHMVLTRSEVPGGTWLANIAEGGEVMIPLAVGPLFMRECRPDEAASRTKAAAATHAQLEQAFEDYAKRHEADPKSAPRSPDRETQ